MGKDFPQDPTEQLWAAIDAVFGSWNNPRAVKYRQIHEIRGVLGTAVNVLSMVFGNTGEASATGVCFSRNPGTGENKFYGEWLVNAQGEDVVAGTRTPQHITKEASQLWASEQGIAETERCNKFPSMEELMPKLYEELVSAKDLLQQHYRFVPSRVTLRPFPLVLTNSPFSVRFLVTRLSPSTVSPTSNLALFQPLSL